MKIGYQFILGKFLLLPLIIIIIIAGCSSETGTQETIHLAFAGPMSGEGAAAGRLMTQAIQMYLDSINSRGGINGKEVKLDIFDDQNDCQDHPGQLAKAKAVANQIVAANNILAVIGHWYSSCSIVAGEIYQQSKIPAITPGSENVKVTLNNEWYFRNIYNTNASGQFLANYVKQVFHQNTVTIIHESADYGAYLAKVFEESAMKLGLEVKHIWKFDNDDKNLDAVLEHIVKQGLEPNEKEAGVILLAVQAKEGIKLVKLIKEASIINPIIGSSSFSEDTFRHGFDNFPKEKNTPGFYINDIYVATPLIFDTANEEAQKFKQRYKARFNEEPDWSAAYAYDTILVLAQALKLAQIKAQPDTLVQDRQQIRDTLASFTNIEDAVIGTTGFNYFDEQRDAQKPVSLGIYKNRNSVSALTQLQVMRSTAEIADLEEAKRDTRVLQINGKYMYKTNVVYTGIEIKEITDLDLKNLVCTMDFYIWFRFQGKFKPEDIEFINAINPNEIKLTQALAGKTKDKITYAIYRVRSQFKADFLNDYMYKQHILGLKFRHRNLPRHNLIYVTDIVGMGLSEETEKADPLIVRMKNNNVLSPILSWSINQVWFFQDIAKKSSLGDPKYLNVLDGLVEYSQFNAGIRIKQNDVTLRGKILGKYSYLVVVSSILTIFLLGMLGRKFKRFLKYFWFLQVLFGSTLLLGGEVIVVNWLAERTEMYNNLKFIVTIFDILWWVMPAYFLTVAAEHFVWTPLEEQIGAIPNIIRHFFAMIIYSITIIAIVVFVYEQQFTSLLATSGMLVMIIGLALKINIANLFSGMVINIERPFRIGDWVKIGQFEEVEVIDINWRATRFKTRNRIIVSLPNSIAVESAVLNFYYPTNVFWLWPTVYVHPRHSPERVKKVLLDAVLSSNLILKNPAPVIYFTGINQWAASYWVAFGADDYEHKYDILAEVWNRIWLHLERAAIQPAVKRQEVYMFHGEEGNQTIASMREREIQTFTN